MPRILVKKGGHFRTYQFQNTCALLFPLIVQYGALSTYTCTNINQIYLLCLTIFIVLNLFLIQLTSGRGLLRAKKGRLLELFFSNLAQSITGLIEIRCYKLKTWTIVNSQHSDSPYTCQKKMPRTRKSTICTRRFQSQLAALEFLTLWTQI